MPDPTPQDAQHELAWKTLFDKVKDLHGRVDAAEAAHSTLSGNITVLANAFQHNLDVLHHLIRTSRGETREQFARTLAVAVAEMQAPPETSELAEVRAQMERQAAEIAALKEELRSRPAEPAPKERRNRPANKPVAPVETTSRPDPSQYAPSNIVAPPPMREDDRPERPFVAPPSMRFDEGL